MKSPTPRDPPGTTPTQAEPLLPVPIRESPPNAELHPEALPQAVTPNEAWFVRCNFPVPGLDPLQHRIEVGGAVQRPVAFGMTALHDMPQRSLEVTTECAGNGRMGMHPPVVGEPWCDLAVSTAVWKGVPLHHLLEHAGVGEGAVEVRFDGADGGEKEGVEGHLTYQRSLPLARALHPDTLVALEMNGRPIPPEHGAPVRLIVPGWYGMASVKWLKRIHVLTEPFVGFFQRDRYVYDGGEGAETRPVTAMRVRSLIHTPQPGACLPRGPLEVRGWAWSGEGALARVEVALDGDGPWKEAVLEPDPLRPHAWVAWRCTFELEATGRHFLRSRARDVAGNHQPDRPPWNRLGYGQNGVRSVIFRVCE
jgi:DMSO/TMAO reductase YedYZ molybdopterin-dependent catalytic subunit